VDDFTQSASLPKSDQRAGRVYMTARRWA